MVTMSPNFKLVRTMLEKQNCAHYLYFFMRQLEVRVTPNHFKKLKSEDLSKRRPLTSVMMTKKKKITMAKKKKKRLVCLGMFR